MSSDKKGILVTGGAGYIGSHAALALLDAGERVVVLDDLSAGERARVPENAAFIEGDVGDAALVIRTIQEHDVGAVLHFAGLVKVEESVREPGRYRRVNVKHTELLARAAAETGVGSFIFSSSAAVYGNAEQNPVPEHAPLAPLSPYAESKKQGEEVLQETFKGTGTKLGILRYFNVAGVDAANRSGYSTSEKPTHLIRGAIWALVRGEQFTLFGNDYPTPDGTCIRDYVHVSDLADAHMAALQRVRGGEACLYNCGSGRGYSNAEVLKTVQQVAGRSLSVHIGPRRPGDPAALIADISKIERELGWKPRYGLEDMIRHELSWAEKHL